MEALGVTPVTKRGFWTVFPFCFLRSQAQLSTGNNLRPRYQMRFSFPNGNLKLQSDFKKRQDPPYFLISGFWSSSLSLQEGAALWAQQPLPALADTSEATAEGPGCRVLLHTCLSSLLWTFPNQLLCPDTLPQTSQSPRDLPDRAKPAMKQQGSCSAFISQKD